LAARPVKPDPAVSPEAAIAALRGLAPAIVPQQAKDARELARDALVAQAWMQFYLGDADDSARLLELCLQQYPELGLPRETEMLYLLVHLRRPELRSATAEIGGALLEIHPALAPVLYYDGLAEQQAGREERAQMLWKRACNEWPRTQHWSVGEACLEAGQSYAGHDLRLARLYLDRAILAGSGDTPDVARRLVAKLPAAH
jgi:tetratricopeptide (TPR) repeat protein